MATSTGAFNDMLDQFIKELMSVFPDDKNIKKAYTKFDMLRSTNPKKCVKKFMKHIGPHAKYVMDKDEAMFASGTCPEFLTDMGIDAYWTPELSQATKDAIWQYLQTLYMLGMTITSIPQDTLKMIEAVAMQCATSMQDGSGGAGGGVDEKALMSSLSGMSGLFSGMLKNK
jgi:hypothetical protein